MDLRSVLSCTAIVCVSWTLANPILEVPARCSDVESTFIDPRMFVEHDCSDVCDYTAPETSPHDCRELCPKMHECLIGPVLQEEAAVRIVRSHVTQKSSTDDNIANVEAAKTQRTISPMRRTSRSATTQPRTAAPLKTTMKEANRLIPNRIEVHTASIVLPNLEVKVITSEPEELVPKMLNHPWQMYLLTTGISFFGTLFVSLVGIMIWRFCRRRNAKLSDAKPGEKDGLVAVTVQTSDTSDTKTGSCSESA